MSILFEPSRIKKLVVRNRFVRSATFDGSAESSGNVSQRQIKLYSDLAEGGIGLIITFAASVHPSGQTFEIMNSFDSDTFILGFKRLTSAVHERGAKIAAQLFHGGREVSRYRETLAEPALAPSEVCGDPYFEGKHRSMTEDEIWELVRAFGDAARRAREAEFDAVQIHGAHGFLFSQFLSPHTNHRSDHWGHSLENRLRFHRECYRDIRKKVGQDYPILIKLGVEDGFTGGLEFSEGKLAAQKLAQWGFDGLEISQGLRGEIYSGTEFHTDIDCINREGYFREWCREVKKLVDIPIMMMGGLRSFGLMEDVVRQGEADFVSLSRPFIREPDLINTWKRDNRHRSTCTSCNKCIEAVKNNKEPLRCVLQKEEAKVAIQK